jgi:CubicO group peptidase (beta-lactamase class C family)/D-alanyl-D-alanine dipeptidase
MMRGGCLTRGASWAWAPIVLISSSLCAQTAVAPAEKYRAAAEMLEKAIEREIKDKGVPALSIALVDDQDIVWAKGFGYADPGAKRPATAETIHRVGSISKLFTDIAVMQLVEKGILDLDAPVQKYLPDFHPKNPFGKPITLRQMMSHHSGLVREPPVGHYFDPTETSLEAMVKSLNNTTLVYAPETHTKYSNAAISTVGYVVEKVEGAPFETHIQRSVLQAMGLKTAGFDLSPERQGSLAKGQMWTYQGRTFEAPNFRLGIGPAGNLYASVLDLGRFLSVVFADGRGPNGPVIKPQSLRTMMTPQFTAAGGGQGFGLGFLVRQLDGKKMVGHNGAAYGFATELEALPEEKLGVALVATQDCANGLAERIGAIALRAMLAARRGEAPAAFVHGDPVDRELGRSLEGRFERGSSAIDLAWRAGRLFAFPESGHRLEFRTRGNDLVDDEALQGLGDVLRPVDGGIQLGGRKLNRAKPTAPQPPPDHWNGLIGEYGWDHDILYILEKDGKLHALIEWFFDYPLTEEAPDVYAFPRGGLYDGEKLYFRRDPNGRALRVEAASVVFERRAIPGEDGKTFRITPLRPIAELRRAASGASPPKETGDFRAPELVDLTGLDPTILLDVRYASDNNFLGTPCYTSARAFQQRPAADALVRAHKKLKSSGFGLLIHDAYRPWFVTKMFWDATPDSGRGFVADPSKGSKHNRGCAVDLTLYDLKTGKPLEMVGGYDEFSDRSSPDYPGGSSLQRWRRDLLRRTMENEGFTVNEVEWWHFDYRDWPKYAIQNESFERISSGGPKPISINGNPATGRL